MEDLAVAGPSHSSYQDYEAEEVVTVSTEFKDTENEVEVYDSEDILPAEIEMKDTEEDEPVVDSEDIVHDEGEALQAKGNADGDKSIDKGEKLVQLPLSRVKSLIKLDPDITLASQEAVFLITKATEMFVNYLAKESYKVTHQNKKKTIQRKDIDECLDTIDAFAFLEGTLDS